MELEPIEAQNNIVIVLPIVIEPVEAKSITDLPTVMPIKAQNYIRLPIVIEPVEAKSITDLPTLAKSNLI